MTAGSIPPGEFRAVIDWGDGSPKEPATIAGRDYVASQRQGRSLMSVSGSHSYPADQVYHGTVTYSHHDQTWVVPFIAGPTPTRRVLHDTVTATVEAKGNAPAQATITLVCAGEKKCQEQVTVTYDGDSLDTKKVTLEPGKTGDLELNLPDEARAALLAGKSITLAVRIGTAPAVQVTVTP